MKEPDTIRLLATTNNAVGDLFTRLTKDLFFSLGYDNLRLNVHKTGREIDIQGSHRLEQRYVVAECKAHKKKMGGDELNKFFGVRGRERERLKPEQVVGYFVSLSGFTETAIEQEKETGDDRVILLNGKQVVSELERAGMLIKREEACERAGQCAANAGLKNAELDGAELLGHELGYLWAVYYAQGKKRTHFALIHADGTPLAETLAKEVAGIDREGGSLHELEYLAPSAQAPDRAAAAAAAIAKYKTWLAEVCGYIQLDGLPADAELGTTRLKMEKLYVPLKASLIRHRSGETDAEETSTGEIHPIGEILEKNQHLAVLAAPGGGKSTLLKRIAMAYAFPERRGEISDRLPERNWLPLSIRCRELRDRAHRPIVELFDDLPHHAGMSDSERTAFGESVNNALRAGLALLLVDGLDELADEGARLTFAKNIRTFLAIFPQVPLIVTSREAGFRHVAGVVASACLSLRLAPFDENDVGRLCEQWTVEVAGDTEKNRADAVTLARTIWRLDRVRALAENPLLLTTLLVVKRWIGELPRSRAALYRTAINVLIRTWNVEGYEPLDEEETLAQLSYVACAMMERGTQQIGQKALLKLLQSARKELEAELQFTRISAEQFIERIEYRSSLLMQTGHSFIDGGLQPVYEFRHLTFQEYLAARGYVEEQYLGRNEGKPLADILEEHFDEERWLETIALAAVLAGRRAEEVIRRLVGAVKLIGRPEQVVSVGQVLLLHQCLVDEVQVTAEILKEALLEVARTYESYARDKAVGLLQLHRGKFGVLYRELVERAYLEAAEGWDVYSAAMADAALYNRIGDNERPLSENVSGELMTDLTGSHRSSRISAAFATMRLAFEEYSSSHVVAKERRILLAESFNRLSAELGVMLETDDEPMALAASWALVWTRTLGLHKEPPTPSTVLALFRHWREAKSQELSRIAAWAIGMQPLLLRNTFSSDEFGDCDEFLCQMWSDGKDEDTYAACVIAWYRRSPWTEHQLGENLAEVSSHPIAEHWQRLAWTNLGSPDKVAPKKWNERLKVPRHYKSGKRNMG